MVITNQLVTVIGTQRQHIVVVWYDINLLPMKNVTERVKRNYVAPAGREWGEESWGLTLTLFLFSLDITILLKYDQLTVWLQSQYKKAT